MGVLIREQVKKVKVIVDDVTFLFDDPKIVHLLNDSNHDYWCDPYEFDLRITTLNKPTAYRTIKKDGTTEYERLA